MSPNPETMTLERFWKSVHRLRLDIDEQIHRRLPTRIIQEKDQYAPTLTLENLQDISHLLFKWADFAPKDYPLALIVPLKNAEQTKQDAVDFDLEQQVPILNSFFLQDLEICGEALRAERGGCLDSYLSAPKQAIVDLRSPQGARTARDSLHISKLPHGRWPDPAERHQSLMQQLALNQACSGLSPGEIMGVNGPPGTGKTTLLRELVADKVVRRAEALAHFSRARDAFSGRTRIAFSAGDAVTINHLDPSLKGYEMMVVSSNNGAVQNVSKELPMQKEIAEQWSEISYLKSLQLRYSMF